MPNARVLSVFIAALIVASMAVAKPLANPKGENKNTLGKGVDNFNNDGKSVFDFDKYFDPSKKETTKASGLFRPHPNQTVQNFNPLTKMMEIQKPSEVALLIDGEVALAARLQA